MNENEWHIKKEVTWGHILTILTLAAGLIGVYMDMNSDIEKNAQEISHVKELNRIQSEQYQRSFEKVENQFEKIDKKLDKLIERELDK